MSDRGYAVFITGSQSTVPVAIFAIEDDATEWAVEHYPTDSRIEAICWETKRVCPECKGAGHRWYTFRGMETCFLCRGSGESRG